MHDVSNLNDLQEAVSKWARHNFPAAQPHQPLLGAVEEIGELCHSHLKLEQGIRGNAIDHHIAKIDAIGDILIYLAHYCSLAGIHMDEAVITAWGEVSTRDWQKNKENGK